MKIGIVTTWFERGAAYVSKQFKEVWEKENEVFIYARGGESVATNQSAWETKHITYGKRFKYTTLDLIDLNHFKTWIKDNELDMIFFNEQHIWKPVLVCVELGIKVGAYIDYYTEETVNLFKVYDFLICNTKRHYSVFQWHPQVFYVPWGTDTSIYNGNSLKNKYLERLVFFHSAGMNPYRKGTDILLKAYDKLNTNASKLLIHSQANLSNFFPELKTMISRLLKEDKLEIIEKTITAPGLYHKGDVYVYPTRLEGIGLTIAEASASGMPVITTNEAPMNEFIKEDINGKLIKVAQRKKRKDNYYWEESVADVDHLSSLLKFYEDRVDKLDQLKEKSLEYGQLNLSWKKNSEQLLKIIKQIEIVDDKRKVIEKITNYEKRRSLKFYVTTSVPYQKLKTRLRSILKG